MKKTIYIIILILLAATAKARVPGYMGLRCILQYQGSLSPQWNNFGEGNYPYYSHNVQIGYVVSRRVEVGLQYTRIDYNSGFHAAGYNYDSYGSKFVDHRKYTGNNVMAYIRLYRHKKGMIAPVGRYFILGIMYQNTKNIFHVREDIYSPGGTDINTYVRSSDVGFCMGMGKNYIFGRRILFSVEGNINIPLSAPFRSMLNRGEYQSENSVTQYPNFYKHINANDVMLMNLIQIKIGLGVLPF